MNVAAIARLTNRFTFEVKVDQLVLTGPIADLTDSEKAIVKNSKVELLQMKRDSLGFDSQIWSRAITPTCASTIVLARNDREWTFHDMLCEYILEYVAARLRVTLAGMLADEFGDPAHPHPLTSDEHQAALVRVNAIIRQAAAACDFSPADTMDVAFRALAGLCEEEWYDPRVVQLARHVFAQLEASWAAYIERTASAEAALAGANVGVA